MVQWLGDNIRGIAPINGQVNGLWPIALIYSDPDDVFVIDICVEPGVVNILYGSDRF